jgi:hypothetical protein
MRKTLTLRPEWIDPKKLSKSALLDAQEKAFKSAVKQFRQQTSDAAIKITAQYPLQSEIVIQFADKDEEQMMALLRKAGAVEIIDAQVYADVRANEPEDFASVKDQLRAKIENR